MHVQVVYYGLVMGWKMPVENSKSEAEKRSGPATGGMNANGSAESGKKRKKRKKEKCGEASTRGAIFVQAAEKPAELHPKGGIDKYYLQITMVVKIVLSQF